MLLFFDQNGLLVVAFVESFLQQTHFDFSAFQFGLVVELKFGYFVQTLVEPPVEFEHVCIQVLVPPRQLGGFLTQLLVLF